MERSRRRATATRIGTHGRNLVRFNRAGANLFDAIRVERRPPPVPNDTERSRPVASQKWSSRPYFRGTILYCRSPVVSTSAPRVAARAFSTSSAG